MRTSFRHQSEAQPPNGPLTAAASPDTPSYMPSQAVRSPRVVIRAAAKRQDPAMRAEGIAQDLERLSRRARARVSR
jgi:hypothetical protein